MGEKAKMCNSKNPKSVAPGKRNKRITQKKM